MDRSLRRELKPIFGNNYWFDTVTYIDLVDLRIRTNDQIIQIFFPKSKRIRLCFIDKYFNWLKIYKFLIQILKKITIYSRISFTFLYLSRHTSLFIMFFVFN